MRLLTIFLLIIPTLLTAQPKKQVELFPLNNVELLESPFRQAQQTDLKYILAMEPDRLLAPYLREAGLTPKAPSYTNWENTGLDGHIGGHYLSALSMMYAATGNQEIKQRLDYMIRELKHCQDNVGTGFIGGTPGSIQLWKEIKEGNIRAGGFDLNGRWVPLYNIHKTYAGLRDAYIFANNEIAFEMLVKLTDWMIDVTTSLTDEQMQDMLRSEHGGLNETFADVYAITGQQKYLDLARRFSHRAILDPLLEEKDKLTGLHANTQIPKVIGYKRIADLEGNEAWDDASRFFFNTVVHNRSVAIGGNSVREHFHAADNFEPMVTDIEGPETCNTYNMMRLAMMHYQTTANPAYIEYYERATYNHILSSQHPEGGFVYFTSHRPGHYRVYSQPHTSMWCCVGSGLENHTKYGEMIYARQDDNLLVNLFIPSRLEWKERDAVISLQTNYPNDGRVRITIEKPGKKPRFDIRVRIPAWAKQSPDEADYRTYNRRWKKGDVIEIDLPMPPRVEPIPDRSGWFAFMRGPIALALVTGPAPTDGLFADDSRMAHIAHGSQQPMREATRLEDINPDDLVPFYTVHEKRYQLYFPNKDVDLGQENEELRQRTIDLIYPGEQQPESDHFVKYERSNTGHRHYRHFRDARGWFSYEVKTDANATLYYIVHKDDLANRTRVFVNDTEITAQPNEQEDDKGFIIRQLPLPADLGAGKHRIRFEPGSTERTERVYEIRIIK